MLFLSQERLLFIITANWFASNKYRSSENISTYKGFIEGIQKNWKEIYVYNCEE